MQLTKLQNKIKKTIDIMKTTGGDSMLASFSDLGPWKILIGTILSARSRDEVTIPVSLELFKNYPTKKELANANPKDIEKIIHRIGFYKNKTRFIIDTSRIIIEKYKGIVPDTLEELLTLPGVGRKVANCELVYAFKKPAIPVDTHVHRISNLLGWIDTKTPIETENELIRIVPKNLWIDVNEWIVNFGRGTCKPVGAKHELCPIKHLCDFYKYEYRKN